MMTAMSADQIAEALTAVSTATLSMQMLKRGIRRCHLAGALPFLSGQPRVAGPAFTLRFVPAREDISTVESYARPGSLRDGIEAMPAGAVAVCDTGGVQAAATVGDILAAAMQARGVAGFVTDGPLRDGDGVRDVGFPVWCSGAVPPPSIGALHYIGCGDVIGCGGAAVFPGDFIVADNDGAVVIPADLAESVAGDSAEQELFERFVLDEVKRTGRVKGIYPPDEETLARFQVWQAKS